MRSAPIVIIAATVAVAAPLWTTQTSGVMATLRGVSAVNDRIAWASGSGNTILHTTDGGTTWEKIASPSPDRLDFRDVDAIDERTAYLLSIGSGPASRIFKTTDAGQTWTLQLANDNPKAFFDAMAFWDRDHGLVIGDSIDGEFYLLMTLNGGVTWARVPPDRLGPALPNEGAFAASGTNVATMGSDAWIGTGAGPRARVLHTPDRGRTWSIAETPLPSGASSGIFSVAFRDATHGIVVGGDYRKESDAVDNAAVTSDGGATWSLVRDRGLSGFRSVVAWLPRTPGAVIALGPSGADWSLDEGRSWMRLEAEGFDTVSVAPGGSVAWAAGQGGRISKLTPR